MLKVRLREVSAHCAGEVSVCVLVFLFKKYQISSSEPQAIQAEQGPALVKAGPAMPLEKGCVFPANVPLVK